MQFGFSVNCYGSGEMMSSCKQSFLHGFEMSVEANAGGMTLFTVSASDFWLSTIFTTIYQEQMR